jgi:hypothetical protein
MDRVELDGLILHPAVGTLGMLEAAQIMPISAQIIDSLVPNLRQVEIIWLRGLTRTRDYAVLIAWSLQNFYLPVEDKPNPLDLVAGLISYVNCLLLAEAVEGRGILTEALSYAGLSPAWRAATPTNLATFRNEQTLHFMRLFHEDAQRMFVHERSQQLGMLGLLLLLIGKSVITAGYSGWINNRL